MSHHHACILQLRISCNTFGFSVKVRSLLAVCSGVVSVDQFQGVELAVYFDFHLLPW
jgi:paraquat-inducible protein B